MNQLAKTIFSYLLILLFLAGIFFAGRYTAPEEYIETIDTVLIKPDTSSIIQSARLGYIKYNYDELVKKFGKIYKDTVIIGKDSLIINYKDSIIVIPVLSADTTFSFQREDTIKQAKFEAKLDLSTRAYWFPIYAIENTAVLRDVTFTIKSKESIQSIPYKWYDSFQVGIGTTVNKLDPIFYVGYGMSFGQIKQLIKDK